MLRAGCRFVVLSVPLEFAGTAEGAAGAGAEFECVLPAAGGCAVLDLLPADFVELDFVVLVFAAVERELAFVATACAFEFPAGAADFFTGATAGFGEITGCTSSAVDRTMSTGAFASAGADADAVTTGACACAGAAAGAGAGGAMAAAEGVLAGTVLTVIVFIGAGGGADAADFAAGAGAATLTVGAATGAGFGGLLTGISDAVAGRAAALAACAKVAALAVGLLLSSSNGGKPGNVLSGT